MNVDDYDNLKTVKDFCGLLNLEFSTEGAYFTLSNSTFIICRYLKLKDLYNFISGFMQCKREMDDEFNKKVLDFYEM